MIETPFMKLLSTFWSRPNRTTLDYGLTEGAMQNTNRKPNLLPKVRKQSPTKTVVELQRQVTILVAEDVR